MPNYLQRHKDIVLKALIVISAGAVLIMSVIGHASEDGRHAGSGPSHADSPHR